MNKIYRTAIVGGGAAGLMAAVELACGKNAIKGEEILLLEKNDRVGKKLVATGNGQGNLTNANICKEFYHGEKEFVESFIANEAEVNLKDYLTKLGIVLTASKDGKIYPLSKQASAVLDIIRARLNSLCVLECVEEEVIAIEKRREGYAIKTAKNNYLAKTVVFAVGGASAKQFGTDGSAYKLLEPLGHFRTKIYPSLVQLKTELDAIRGLKGLKETAKVTAIVNGKKAKSATGDLLFTEFGVSGSSVFSVSSAVAGKDNASLDIEFVPELGESELIEIIENRLREKNIFGDNVLVGIINKRVGQAVLKRATALNAREIVRALKHFNLNINGNLGFNYAQVTRGGIITDNINSKTYESKLSKGLYIVGEVLDVDGDCGGYNLAFAFVSGIIAAREIKRTERKDD